MKRPRCKHDNPNDAKFCGECGTRLESVCAACGAANPPANKFCGQCGASLALAILYALEVQRTQGMPNQIRVGLNSGRRRWG